MPETKFMIVEVPKNWGYGDCEKCPRGWACNEVHGVDGDCPLTTAKEAVKADLNNVVVTHIHGAGARIENPRIDGKPVDLYAVKK